MDSVGESSEDKQPQQILDSATCYALDLLLLLLGLYWMQNDMGDFVEDGECASVTQGIEPGIILKR